MSFIICVILAIILAEMQSKSFEAQIKAKGYASLHSRSLSNYKSQINGTLKLLPEAVTKYGAACLDGSAPGYYYLAGEGRSIGAEQD
jgi:hypothetical protein